MQKSNVYIPLKCQTEYSILRSCIKIDELIHKAKSYGLNYLAICDLNNLSGFYEFYKKCHQNGIKPIIGLSLDVYDPHPKNSEQIIQHRLTLYCKNYNGLKNLFKILNFKNNVLNFKNDKIKITSQTVLENAQHLICTFPNIMSIIYKLIELNLKNNAETLLKQYIDVFGKDKLFFELWKDGIINEDKANLIFLELAKKYSIRYVAVNNCQYLNENDKLNGFAALYSIRNNIDFNLAVSKIINSGNFHFKSYDEMEKNFSHVPDALKASKDIAFECNVEIINNNFFIPKFNTPINFDDNSYLEFLTKNKLEILKDKNINYDLYLERLEYELNIIKKLNFSSYFLILWDIVSYARQNLIPVGPGRGSSCSSLVCYLLDITKIDPIKYQLSFERFLNPNRIKMPDIDVDFSSHDRYKIIDYVISKYSNERTAQIITFNRFRHKALFNVLSKILNLSDQLIKNISPLFNKIISEKSDITFNDIFTKTILSKYYNNNIKKMCEIACSLLNNVRQVSIHAGGIIITPYNIYENLPLSFPHDNINVTGIEMNALAELGYLKIDLLGVEALEKINNIINTIKTNKNVNLSIENLPLNDKKTYDLIASGKTFGVFQLETNLFKKYLPKLKPTNINELATAIALIRPGPIQSNILNEYILRKNGRLKYTFIHPKLNKILNDTFGVIVFQEQIIQIVTQIFGYPPSEADIFREIISKKAFDKIENEREKFLNYAKKQKIDDKIAIEIFNILENFSKYCFNKAHSVAYAHVAYYMAYLLANYPLEYVITILNNDIQNKILINELFNYLKEINIPIYTIDINLSDLYHQVYKNGILMGFLSINNINNNLIQLIINERKNGNFIDVHDFINRILKLNTNIKVNDLEILIKNNVFNSIKNNLSDKDIYNIFKKALTNEITLKFPIKQNNNIKNTHQPLLNFQNEENNVYTQKKFINYSNININNETICILNHLPYLSISRLLKENEIKNEIISYGEIIDYNPLISQLKLKEPLDLICENIIELFITKDLLEKINKFSKNEIIFFKCEIKFKNMSNTSEINDNNKNYNKIFLAKNIISYKEAYNYFIVILKLKSKINLNNEELELIKKIINQNLGNIPVYIKIDQIVIATNKRVNFTENFINDIYKIENFAKNIDILTELKLPFTF